MKSLLDRAWFPSALLAFGVVCVSTAGLIAHRALAEATPLAVAAWRLGLAAIFFISLQLRRPKTMRPAVMLTTKERARLLLAGLMLASHFLCWFGSLKLTSVSIATLLACTTPLWNALIGLFTGKSRSITPLFWIGLSAALVGIVLVMSPRSGFAGGSTVGDLLALAAGLAFAVYLVLVDGLQHLPSSRIVTTTYSGAAVILWIALVFTERVTLNYSAPVWEALLLLAAVPQIMGHTILNNALRHFSAHLIAFSILAEPVITAVLAVILIHDRFTVVQLIGGVVVLSALGVVLARSRSPAALEAL